METVSKPNKIGRIGFIDLMRAFAILMMVQGHLTDALLRTELRNPENIIYNVWLFMRGATAPIFFFASGIIFSILLIKEEKFGKGIHNPRFIKGLKRTLLLLIIGYTLQFNSSIIEFFITFDFSLLKYFLTVHVLHIIGIAIFLISVLYLITNKMNNILYLVYFVFGTLFFIFEPNILKIEWSDNFYSIFSNYLTKSNGSVFTLFPWIGYSLYGASLGAYLVKKPQLIYDIKLFISMLVIGTILMILTNIDYVVGLLGFDISTSYMKFSFALIFSGFFGFIDRITNKIDFIYVIGRETLLIFIVHFMLIYGTFTGMGLVQIFGKTTLNGWECLVLALLLETVMILLAVNASYYRRYVYEYSARISSKFRNKLS